jgi:hypothetical protein
VAPAVTNSTSVRRSADGWPTCAVIRLYRQPWDRESHSTSCAITSVFRVCHLVAPGIAPNETSERSVTRWVGTRKKAAYRQPRRCSHTRWSTCGHRVER